MIPNGETKMVQVVDGFDQDDLDDQGIENLQKMLQETIAGLRNRPQFPWTRFKMTLEFAYDPCQSSTSLATGTPS